MANLTKKQQEDYEKLKTVQRIESETPSAIRIIMVVRDKK